MEALETDLLEDEAPPVVRVAMTKEQFIDWNPHDGFLYEYEDGFALQTTGMKKEERYLFRNLQKAFRKTEADQQEAMLLAESDVWLTNTQKRIPDVAFFTAEQITASNTKTEPIPAWVIELISSSDRVKKVEEKILEYFMAGVQVVWHVHPALRMVRVFTSTRHATTYFENDALPAPSAVPDLSLTVGELFIP